MLYFRFCFDVNSRHHLQGRIHDSGTGVTYIYKGNGERVLDYVNNRNGKWKLKILYLGINFKKILR